jgi:hypothetical protein
MGNRQLISKSLAVLAMGFSLAQAQAPKSTLEEQLSSQYKLTTLTADNSNIVTMGSVLILQKRGFSAGAVSNKVPTQNTYKDGQIKGDATTTARRLGGLSSLGRIPGLGGLGGAANSAVSAAGPSRDFVNGEKLYITRIAVDRSKDAVIFDLMSDAFGNAGRYKASLAFQFPKGSVASADLTQVQPVIEEVFKFAPTEDQNANVQQGGQQATQPAGLQTPPAQVTEAEPDPLRPILPPPPPPPDTPAPAPVVETKVIEVGQTKDQVVAVLGKPDRIVKGPGTKEIYQYKDIKFTFVNGKMTDAE